LDFPRDPNFAAKAGVSNGAKTQVLDGLIENSR
jgi:hypothetical protein